MNTAFAAMIERIKELTDDYPGMIQPRTPKQTEAIIRSAWHLHRAAEELEGAE